MKKYLTLFILCFLLFSPPVFAHVLQSNGAIGAVLHIDPEDDPIVGQQASFFFDFKDKQSKFKPENCECTFSISENGKEIYSQALSNSSASYTFTKKGSYKIKISGKPQENADFKPFVLTYDVDTEREANSSTNLLNRNTVVVAIALIIFIVVAIFLVKRSRKVE